MGFGLQAVMGLLASGMERLFVVLIIVVVGVLTICVVLLFWKVFFLLDVLLRLVLLSVSTSLVVRRLLKAHIQGDRLHGGFGGQTWFLEGSGGGKGGSILEGLILLGGVEHGGVFASLGGLAGVVP